MFHVRHTFMKSLSQASTARSQEILTQSGDNAVVTQQRLQKELAMAMEETTFKNNSLLKSPLVVITLVVITLGVINSREYGV